MLVEDNLFLLLDSIGEAVTNKVKDEFSCTLGGPYLRAEDSTEVTELRVSRDVKINGEIKTLFLAVILAGVVVCEILEMPDNFPFMVASLDSVSNACVLSSEVSLLGDNVESGNRFNPAVFQMVELRRKVLGRFVSGTDPFVNNLLPLLVCTVGSLLLICTKIEVEPEN